MTPDPSRFRIELAGQAHAHINRLVTRAEQRGQKKAQRQGHGRCDRGDPVTD